MSQRAEQPGRGVSVWRENEPFIAPKLTRSPVMSRARGVIKASWLGRLDLVLLTMGAATLWVLSVRQVELRGMSDLGLISVLPISAFLALFILTVSFVLCVRDPRSTPLLLFHIVALVVMVYGVTALVGDVADSSATWRHIGIAEYIQRTGGLGSAIDPDSDWPGFFSATAFITEVLGIRDVGRLAEWSPVFFNLLYLGPLLVIFRTATGDERLVWVSVWLFYLGNWAVQNYFAPSALAYFFYLAFLAIVVRWFAVGSRAAGQVPQLWIRAWSAEKAASSARHGPVAELTPAKRIALIVFAIIVFGAGVQTQLLVPLAALACVTLLAVFGLSPSRGRPALLAVLIGAWLSLLAVSLINGQVAAFVQELRTGSGFEGEGITSEGGSAAHVLVERLPLAMAAVFWALAVAGALKAFRRGRRDIVFGVLAIAAFPLLLLQRYVEDVVPQVYLVALPFMAFFVASLLYPLRDLVYTRKDVIRSWRVSRLLVIGSLILVSLSLVIRLGNERMNFFTAAELDAVRQVYAVAPRGSLLIAGDENLPWKFRDYERYDYELVVEMPRWDRAQLTKSRLNRVVRDVGELMRERGPSNAYLILTRSQSAAWHLLGAAPDDALERLQAAVVRSGVFTTLYRNRDATIFVVKPRNGGKPV
jgi:hypothetical protein